MTLLITGGASGIGAATAKLAAQRGHKVAINYRSRDAQAKKLAKMFIDNFVTFEKDVAPSVKSAGPTL